MSFTVEALVECIMCLSTLKSQKIIGEGVFVSSSMLFRSRVQKPDPVHIDVSKRGAGFVAPGHHGHMSQAEGGHKRHEAYFLLPLSEQRTRTEGGIHQPEHRLGTRHPVNKR